ncbi:MAG: hypothetical protein LBU24_02755 [Methanocalculaceae archaeon]|nr:hypothetical protein [Methanocalculaceae archaeon]
MQLLRLPVCNTASGGYGNYDGGVDVASGRFTMSGGTSSGNKPNNITH